MPMSFSAIQMQPPMKYFSVPNAVNGVQKVSNKFSKWKKTAVIFDSDMMMTWWVLNNLFSVSAGLDN